MRVRCEKLELFLFVRQRTLLPHPRTSNAFHVSEPLTFYHSYECSAIYYLQLQSHTILEHLLKDVQRLLLNIH